MISYRELLVRKMVQLQICRHCSQPTASFFLLCREYEEVVPSTTHGHKEKDSNSKHAVADEMSNEDAQTAHITSNSRIDLSF